MVMSKNIHKPEENNDEKEDVVFESEEQDDSDVIKKLRIKNKQISSEKQEYLEGWQRSKADLINAKRSFEEERRKLLKFATTDLITQIIPVLDSFEIAFNDKKFNEEPLLKDWVVGIHHIYSQLLSILKENGVEELNPLDQEFNPVFHEPLEMAKIDNPEKDGIIMKVIQRGYLLNGEVIRPAKVVVGEFKMSNE